MTNKKVLDLREEVREIEDEVIPELRELHEELEERAAETDDPSEITVLQQQSDQLEEQARFYLGLVETFEGWLDEDPEAKFVIKQLSAYEQGYVADEARGESYEIDPQTQQLSGVPKTEYAKRLSAERAVVDLPDAAAVPDEPSDIGDLPSNVFQWLFQEIDAHNTAGADVELEGFTLSRALTNSEN